jgi:hypothetical protein
LLVLRLCARAFLRQRLLALIAAVALVAAGVLPALAAIPPAVFELDRNAVDGAAAGEDWGTLFPSGGGSAVAATFVTDPANATIFTTGGSKDDLDIPSWRHTAGSVPDKDEITNAYAAAYASGGDTVLYFGADRFANNGSSTIGFWFFRNAVETNANGTFSGAHSVGDILIVSDFTQGGAISTIKLFTWVGSGGTATANGTLNLVASGVDCTSALGNLCATVNGASTPSPWPYTPKSGPSGSFPSGAFFEGGVNLTQLGLSGCFSSFLAETRSSPSVDAQLKDFVGGRFALCDANISIAPNAANEVGASHDFTVTVARTGAVAGPVSGATVVGTIANSGGSTATFVDVDGVDSDGNGNAGDDCVTGAGGQCVLRIVSATAGVATVSATASVPIPGGPPVVRSTDGVAPNSGPATKIFVDAAIALSPLTDTNGIEELHTITATVHQNDGLAANATAGGFVGDGTTGFGPAPNGTLVSFSFASNTIGATFVGGVSSCTTSGGACAVQITSATAGTVVVHATTSFAVLGVPLTRATATGGNNSADASKAFVDGSLTWLKVDNRGQPLGGATFEVCRTANFNSTTGTFDPIAPVCVSVTDNAAPDTSGVVGTFALGQVVLGRYTIRETAAPPGYTPDPRVETVELSIAAPNGAVELPFVNVPQFRLIVLTCSQAGGLSLVRSTVTPQGTLEVTDTIDVAPFGLDAAQLCNLGGAQYNDLLPGTYPLSVKIPK